MRKLSGVMATLLLMAHAAHAQGTGTLIVSVHSKDGPVGQADVTVGGMKFVTDADGIVRLSLPT